ncbi:uncharacterized protein LOC128735887 [Sabethes cyaneus]|uniref:uncharacterized protein LOC128735887 n=1 Tax=Sabethes cyaneus TaxID=53552 RepID=UPI00237E49F7|nr:uncharacterized protein LOC128735887 [Sabethes cyaneus]
MSHHSVPVTKAACAGCTRPEEADDLVQCDACDTWWPFSCANVTESVSDHAWVCIRCKSNSRASTRASVISRSSSQLADNMARLREQQELEKQRAEIELEKKFLREQQNLLEVTIAAEAERRSQVSREDSMRRVEDWIGSSAGLQTSAAGQMPAAAAAQQHNPGSTHINSDAEAARSSTKEVPTGVLSKLDNQQHSPPLRAQTIPTSAASDMNHSQPVPSEKVDADRQKTMDMVRNLRVRLTRCLEKSDPTFPELADLQEKWKLLSVNNTNEISQPGAGELRTNPEQTQISTGKCQASESQINKEIENSVSQVKSLPTMQNSQNEQQRLVYAHSNLINNNNTLSIQTSSHCTPFPLANTQPISTVHHSMPQLFVQQSYSTARQPIVQRPNTVQQSSVSLSVQPPSVSFSMPQPSVWQTSVQPTVQQTSLPLSVQQSLLQPSCPVVQPFVQQPILQQPNAMQQQPSVSSSVQPPPEQQPAVQSTMRQPLQRPFVMQPHVQPIALQPSVHQSSAAANYAQQSFIQQPAAHQYSMQSSMQQPHTTLQPSGIPLSNVYQEVREPTPTQQQLTSRQSLARDLPTFSGDPAEWPIFISNFEYTTKTCGYTNGENMIRLQRCLRGHALESVRSRLVYPTAVPQVIETLRMRYGRPELLINTLLQKVRTMPAPRGDRLESLIEFAMTVQELCDHIEAANEKAHLSNPTLLQELVGKLPASQKLLWADYKRKYAVVDLKTFSDYMTGVMQAASSVVSYEPDPKKNSGKEKIKVYVNSHTTKPEEVSSVTASQSKPCVCLHCDKEGHKLRDCQSFKILSIDDRWRRIRALSFCQICLYRHGRRACRNNNRCNVSGCQFKHHPLLHGKPMAPTTRVVNSHSHRTLNSGVLFRIIPVTLHGISGKINTYAFLDEGSSVTLVEGSLVTKLGITGDPHPLCLRWTGNTSRVEEESRTVTITISGSEQQRHFKLVNARTVKNLDLPTQSFDLEKAAEKFTYLKQLPIQSYHNARPEILIGLDNLELAVPLKTKEGDGPIAVKTKLGWCIYGSGSRVHEAFSFHICGCTRDDELHETVKQFFAVEENGVKQLGTVLSAEEKRAQELLENTTKRVGEHFETGLLWKEDEIELPDSYSMALRRYHCLQQRMERNPALGENIRRQINEYVQKGYAQRAISADLKSADPRKVWFLPLGAVTNPKKPGKVRLIWDAAAKVPGVSLNSTLLKGPDQLTLLPAVLFRFRMFCIAVSADIEQMFHQLFIRPADRNSQRFLWCDQPGGEVETYLMNVATFGATCSPASAQFVKNLNAKEHIQQYPRAVEGILKSHYVDDFLDSFGSESEAEKVSAEVRLVHKNGGFHLRNWRSNSKRVLTGLGESAEGDSKNLNLDCGEQVDRVLGMLWSASSDVLSFSAHMSDEVRNLLESNTRPTKRQVLRCVMSLFDPLGLLAPFIIHGKVLIQELWRAGTEWDEGVGDEVFEHWNRWIRMIEFVSTVKIPRCYFPRATEATYKNAQLHVFVDASEIAYSCAVYIRTTEGEGAPNCVLVSGKTKVAPLKPMSIPRLELQGCVLGTRLLNFVLDNHPTPFAKRFLWTDSTTARSWIRSDPRRYKPFVAHRIGEILETTDVSEWRWVPSKLNPADEATKWGQGPYFNPDSKWFDGPDFLRFSEEAWPKANDLMESTTEEVRPAVMLHFAFEPVLDFNRFSTWTRLLRTVAYVLRFLSNISKPKPKIGGSLMQTELLGAENTIWKLVQRESYPDEIAILERAKSDPTAKFEPLDRRSQLYTLMPTIDEIGLLRQQSRIVAAEYVAYDTRYPIILPTKHRAVSLLTEDYHRRYHHANNETVVNELRQRYVISSLRRLVKTVSYKCQMCKIRKARPTNPPMAALPPARLAVHVPPFTHVGLDYFGPFFVKVGRSQVKRWIALFTCLTIRAVHLEVAFSLSTVSCISCVRRFIGRRGPPSEIFSDNGTNFQGAERILREQISKGLSETFTSTTTKWNFNPPGAPHMGGAWERLVRSVKSAMKDAYNEGKLSDEELLTLVVEAENIVNSRPLTYLPLDSEESAALTPNHFLLGQSSGAKPASVDSSGSQTNLRDTWGGIRRQLDIFWQRFLLEYLPVIRRQPKLFSETKPLRVGDLVLVTDGERRNEWIRGKIIQTFPGVDGRVRQASVQTRQGIFRRPTTRLAVLDVDVRSAVPEDFGKHRGEDVETGTAEMVTLDQPIQPLD